MKQPSVDDNILIDRNENNNEKRIRIKGKEGIETGKQAHPINRIRRP